MKAERADAELWYKKYCKNVLAKRQSKKQIRKASQAAAKRRRVQRLTEVAMRVSVRKTVASMLGI